MRFASLAFVLFAGLGTAIAERPRTMIVKTPDWKPRAAGVLPQEPTSRLIYLHRCPETGCVVFQGPDDSRSNTSSIVRGTVTIGAFTRGDTVWNQVVQCVRETYAPFNIGITDVDPGPDVPHYEHIVGGRDSDLRNPNISGAGGVSPFSCGEIPNAITYTFDVWGSNALVICGVVAQETAHAFGLEHEMNPSDPLTYLDGPYPKRFQAADTPCGEYENRPCDCRAGLQNTYEHLLAMFGMGLPTAPSISILSPTSGKTVQPGFSMRVDATDDVAVDRVELLIDDVVVAESNQKPFTIVAPDGITEGPHTLVARAYDVQGTPGQSEPLPIVMGPPCTAGAGCEGTDVCVMGVCIAGPDAPGGLGHFCQADTECLSMQCQADAATGSKFCVSPCDLSPGSCPEEFSCIPTSASEGVCWPTGGGGCCEAGGAGAPGATLLGLGVLVLVFRRRRN
jgi:hypothetical protein